jgi:hypothetical protein
MAVCPNWKMHIRRRYGIEPVSEAELNRLALSPAVLWTSRCCKTKRSRYGTPAEMYDSCVTRYFYRWVTMGDLPYAIVSDRYGLHFSDEALSCYDTHPSDLSAEDRRKLGQEIGEKARKVGFATVVFYNNSPLMSLPYFEMLGASGLRVFFATRLPTRM